MSEGLGGYGRPCVHLRRKIVWRTGSHGRLLRGRAGTESRFQHDLFIPYPPMLPNGVTEMSISDIMFRGNLDDVSVQDGTTRIARKLDQGGVVGTSLYPCLAIARQASRVKQRRN